MAVINILSPLVADMIAAGEVVERPGSVGEKADPYQNRYLGFLAERLLTLYFVYYKDKYKIAYVDKKFISGKE